MDRMKVAELRAELSNRGADTKGTKPVLLARLKEIVAREQQQEEAEVAAPEQVEDSPEAQVVEAEAVEAVEEEAEAEQTEEKMEEEEEEEEVSNNKPIITSCMMAIARTSKSPKNIAIDFTPMSLSSSLSTMAYSVS